VVIGLPLVGGWLVVGWLAVVGWPLVGSIQTLKF